MAKAARGARAVRSQVGASGSALLSARLSHPSSIPMPNDLLPPQERRESSPEVGTGALYSVDGGRRNGFDADAPWAWRAVEAGHGAELQVSLVGVRAAVVEGATLMEVVADGTLKGWHAREALSAVVSEPLANWDTRRGRTQGERLAVVERAIGELGALRPMRRGGWTVGGVR